MRMGSADTVFLIAAQITHLMLTTRAKVHALLHISEIQPPTSASLTARPTLIAISKSFKTQTVDVTQAARSDNIAIILAINASVRALLPL
jgi:outer membrane lipopolysaccharide assembly protein LptE/RlpB